MPRDVVVLFPLCILIDAWYHYLRWVPLPEENEAVVLDIAFPESGVIDVEDRRVYLILHGINGDSNEGYVVDFIRRQVSQGNIVAVQVTRGIRGYSPILGDNILHFARISDVSAAARALRKAINRVSSSPNNRMLLAGVGYSMGGIMLANYVAQSETNDLDAAISLSGALDTKQQMYFERSAYLWQPFIAKAMRDNLLSRYSRQIKQKLGEEQFQEVMKAQSLVDFDRALFAPYNGFESLDDYYSQMYVILSVHCFCSIPCRCLLTLCFILSFFSCEGGPWQILI